jgi:hypothetical protein
LIYEETGSNKSMILTVDGKEGRQNHSSLGSILSVCGLKMDLMLGTMFFRQDLHSASNRYRMMMIAI